MLVVGQQATGPHQVRRPGQGDRLDVDGRQGLLPVAQPRGRRGDDLVDGQRIHPAGGGNGVGDGLDGLDRRLELVDGEWGEVSLAAPAAAVSDRSNAVAPSGRYAPLPAVTEAHLARRRVQPVDAGVAVRADEAVHPRPQYPVAGDVLEVATASSPISAASAVPSSSESRSRTLKLQPIREDRGLAQIEALVRLAQAGTEQLLGDALRPARP